MRTILRHAIRIVQVMQVGAQKAVGCVRSWNGPHIMLIKVNLKKDTIAPAGVHVATVRDVKPKGEAKLTLVFEVGVGSDRYTAHKDYAAKIECGSPLLVDAETLLGEPIEGRENHAEFNTDALVGKSAQVVIEHRRGAGGKKIAVVVTVLAAAPAEAALA